MAEIIVRHAKFDEVKAALIKNVDDMILFNKLVIKMPSKYIDIRSESM